MFSGNNFIETYKSLLHARQKVKQTEICCGEPKALSKSGNIFQRPSINGRVSKNREVPQGDETWVNCCSNISPKTISTILVHSTCQIIGKK